MCDIVSGGEKGSRDNLGNIGRLTLTFLRGVIIFQEAVGDTLEELWISYNLIEKLKGIHVMKKLKILYMSNNSVKDWGKPGPLGSLLKFFTEYGECASAETAWVKVGKLASKALSGQV